DGNEVLCRELLNQFAPLGDFGVKSLTCFAGNAAKRDEQRLARSLGFGDAARDVVVVPPLCADRMLILELVSESRLGGERTRRAEHNGEQQESPAHRNIL